MIKKNIRICLWSSYYLTACVWSKIKRRKTQSTTAQWKYKCALYLLHSVFQLPLYTSLHCCTKGIRVDSVHHNSTFKSPFILSKMELTTGWDQKKEKKVAWKETWMNAVEDWKMTREMDTGSGRWLRIDCLKHSPYSLFISRSQSSSFLTRLFTCRSATSRRRVKKSHRERDCGGERG